MKKKKLHVPHGAGTKLVHLVAEAIGFGDDVVHWNESCSTARTTAFTSVGPTQFAISYLQSECLSKFADGDFAKAKLRRDVAFEGFFSSEVKCGDSNARLVDALNRPNLDTPSWSRARAIVGSLLGSFDFEEFISSCGFGPGASTGLRRKVSSQQNKWEKSTHITAEALPYYLAFARWASVEIPGRLEIVAGNTVTTVPKNSKTDRVIAIEPDWNMFFQKGLGKMIRRRLRRLGLLTRESQFENRAVAYQGSVDGSLATLDMRAASDTISTAVVEALLPDSWLCHVLALRSERGEVNGTTLLYEKISSMGNGFTFELETLIFYALAKSKCGKDSPVYVYGDDVIVATPHATAVMSLFEEAGFEVNSTKSFWTGDFRESCGGHYWSGVDVTPFYLRHTVETIGDAIVLHNNVVAWHARLNLPLSDEWRAVVRECRRLVPRSIWGPYGIPGCLWADWDECTPRWSKRYQCYEQKAIARTHKYSDISSMNGSFVYKLWVVDPELESSRLARSTSVEKVTLLRLCRGAWTLLPVRLA